MTTAVAYPLIFSTIISGVWSMWTCAYYRNIWDQQPQYMDCLLGCCGESLYRHCCQPIGLIVGCLIAGLVLILMSIILFCCWRRQRSRRKRMGRSKYPRATISITRPAPYVATSQAPAYSKARDAGYPNDY
ncbi:uncharacterized protein LOC121369098 [Gigantopelta aegis]|uniref:uncharacterized protein LOC121369098 n=1 Tax=Gigantopelta aegis TaxID=1735272 RepID=UPI001B88BD1B|nr:uncharacterized protein LOC121369098 [Gigantopelta aegis]